jgi:RNA polymerase sigma factor (sigma-70 family)
VDDWRTLLTNSVEVLVARAKRGDKKAFEMLRKMFSDRIFAQCKMYLHDDAEIEDAVQETFVNGWDRLHQLHVDRAFGNWIVSVSTRICLNRLISETRRRNREQSLCEAQRHAEDCAFEEFESRIHVEQLEATIYRTAIQFTPPWDDRDLHIFHEHIIVGETIIDIARRLGISEGTVHFRLRTRIRPVLKIVGKSWKT